MGKILLSQLKDYKMSTVNGNAVIKFRIPYTGDYDMDKMQLALANKLLLPVLMVSVYLQLNNNIVVYLRTRNVDTMKTYLDNIIGKNSG